MPRIKILGLNQSMGHCFVLITTSLHPGYHQISRETSLNAKGRIIVQLLTSFHPGREVVPLMLFFKTEEGEFNSFFFHQPFLDFLDYVILQYMQNAA